MLPAAAFQSALLRRTLVLQNIQQQMRTNIAACQHFYAFILYLPDSILHDEETTCSTLYTMFIL
jgi:hypothetical protein